MKSVRVGSSGDCVSSLDCYPLLGNASGKRAWIGQAPVMLATLNNGEQRHVIKVSYRRRGEHRSALMDCVTGTMYRDNRCLTSDVLEIVSLDKGDHLSGLLAKRAPDWGSFGRES